MLMIQVSFSKNMMIFKYLLQRTYGSAIILRKENALVVYTKLSIYKAPIFLGKDLIYEYFVGYTLSGQFPSKIYQKSKNLFQSGVFEFWRKYINFLMIQGTSSRIKFDPKAVFKIRKKRSVTVGALTLLPAFGLLITIIVFVFEVRFTLFTGIRFILLSVSSTLEHSKEVTVNTRIIFVTSRNRI